jgi:hypothetical protein
MSNNPYYEYNKWGIHPQLYDFFLKAKTRFEAGVMNSSVIIISGYRTKEEQQVIRKKFGYKDDNEPSGSRHLPLAARPGHSLHEKGLAFDVKVSLGIFKYYNQFADIILKISDCRVQWLGFKDMGHFEWNSEYFDELS